MYKEKSFLRWGLFFFALSLVYSLYVFSSVSGSKKEIVSLDREVGELRKEILSFQNEKILEAVSAQKKIKDLKIQDLRWSKVIGEIQKVIPFNANGTPKVNISGYSGSEDGAISLKVSTLKDADSAYFDVADLIESFEESPVFKDSFVGSVSVATDLEENEILSFNLTTKYVGK